ncbi:MAG: hypothetical protein WC750_05930 [Patescibacteria group bacterium]|jgi:hypothetical protein
MSGSFHTNTNKPCDCGHNRWKTLGDAGIMLVTKYQCRHCGAIRNVTRVQALKEGWIKK